MDSYIYFRILGYMATIFLHGSNMVQIGQHSKEAQEDYRLREFLELRERYLTGWTFVLQILFAIIGLVCDLGNLYFSGRKDFKQLRDIRDVLFCGVVWPSVIIVFSLFWTIFSYDRSLVYPEFLDQILSPMSNHIMHTFILPLALWEVWFQPRTQPKSHKRYIQQGVLHFLLYLSVIFFTYIERGIWLYPILETISGTIYLPLLIIFTAIMALISYYLQWGLVRIRWGHLEEKKKITKKNR